VLRPGRRVPHEEVAEQIGWPDGGLGAIGDVFLVVGVAVAVVAVVDYALLRDGRDWGWRVSLGCREANSWHRIGVVCRIFV
jgi:hypothetical protein